LNELTEELHLQHLQEKIEKMQKTASGLKKMIDEKDPDKDYELIDSLKNLHLTTINNINQELKKLAQLYNKMVSKNNNN
jgi:hypothetical protein